MLLTSNLGPTSELPASLTIESSEQHQCNTSVFRKSGKLINSPLGPTMDHAGDDGVPIVPPQSASKSAHTAISECKTASSAPVALPIKNLGLQNSGLDWSGSIESPSLIQSFQELSKDNMTNATCQAQFQPSQNSEAHQVVALSRVSEEISRSGHATSTCRTDSAANSCVITSESVSPNRNSLAQATAEFSVESPFEASQFQEDPIARPTVVPEISAGDIARPAATLPAAITSTEAFPSYASRLASSEKAAQQAPIGPRQPEHPGGVEGQPVSSATLEDNLSLSEMGGNRKTGMKSLSVLEQDGIPLLRNFQTSSTAGENHYMADLRQRLAQQGGFHTPAGQLAHSLERKGISSRSQTVPTIELLRALEVSSSLQRRRILPTIASGASYHAEDEELMAPCSLQQDIHNFNPVEDLARSPTRAPSLFDFANSQILEDAEWVIKSSELELGRRIGSGSFGEVFRAQWRHTDVAVKRITDVTEALVEDFEQEVALMAKLKHPNIVQFLGACLDYPNLAIVTQYMPRGSLFNLLHRAKVKLDDRQKLWMALDCARGMHYLHSCKPPIVHGDVSSKNMLVDRDFSIRVADFGMSRQRRKAMLSAKGSGGTAEWTAPEVLRGLPYTESCDIWSFGVVFYELMTQQVPWADLSTIQVVGAVGWGDASLQIPQELSPAVKELMTACLERDPQRRPNFEQIIVLLRKIRQSLPEKPAAQPNGTSSSSRQLAENITSDQNQIFQAPHPIVASNARPRAQDDSFQSRHTL